jgi:exonuclease SbcC
LLQIESGSMGERMALKRKELESAVEKVKEIVHPYVDGLDENTIELLIQRKTSLRGFVSDSGRVANVEKVVKYLADADYMSETEGDNSVIDIQRVLSGLVKNITNQEFDNLNIKHKFEKVEEIYGEGIKDIKKQMTVETLKKKSQYLEKVVWEKENTEIHEIKKEMKDLIVRKEKMKNIRQQLNELSKIYDKSVDDYKNITLK